MFTFYCSLTVNGDPINLRVAANNADQAQDWLYDMYERNWDGTFNVLDNIVIK